jgi:hypothetical protein
MVFLRGADEFTQLLQPAVEGGDMNNNSVLFSGLFLFSMACSAAEVSSSTEEGASLTEDGASASSKVNEIHRQDGVDRHGTPSTRTSVETPVVGHWTYVDAGASGWSSEILDLRITDEHVDVHYEPHTHYTQPIAILESSGRFSTVEGGTLRLKNVDGAKAFSIELRVNSFGLDWCSETTGTCVALTRKPF